MPVYCDILLSICNILIAALGVGEPRPQMLLTRNGDASVADFHDEAIQIPSAGTAPALARQKLRPSPRTSQYR